MILRSSMRGKSRKREQEGGNEAKCEILRNEKSDEREVQNIAELNKHLADFIRSTRRTDGEDYEPSSLRCFVSSIKGDKQEFKSQYVYNKHNTHNK